MDIRSQLRKVKLQLIDKGLYPIHGKTGNRILAYHGVSPSYKSTEYSTRRFLTPDQFEAQLLNFKKYYNVIKLEDIFGGNGDNSKYNLALTLDDGYLNNLDYVVPLLEKHRIHATLYITAILKEGYEALWADYYDLARNFLKGSLTIGGTEYRNENLEFVDGEGELLSKRIKAGVDFKLKKELIDSVKDELPEIARSNEYLEFWKLMNADQIRKASESEFISIGSHSVMHNNLGNIPLEAAKKELKESKEYLENITQEEVNSIAYPDGDYTRDLVDAAEQLGYKYQLACSYLFKEDLEDPRIMDRMLINDEDDRSWNTFNYYLKHSRQYWITNSSY